MDSVCLLLLCVLVLYSSKDRGYYKRRSTCVEISNWNSWKVYRVLEVKTCDNMLLWLPSARAGGNIKILHWRLCHPNFKGISTFRIYLNPSRFKKADLRAMFDDIRTNLWWIVDYFILMSPPKTNSCNTIKCDSWCLVGGGHHLYFVAIFYLKH